MIGDQKTGLIPQAIISTVAHEGLRITTRDGQPARLAILDANGAIIAEGEDVAAEVRAVSVNGYRAFLKGQGHLRVFNVAEAENQDLTKKAA